LPAALVDGCADRRRVDPQMFDLFPMLRSLTYPGWIIPRMAEPGCRARSARAIATAMPLIHAYLGAPDA